MVLHPSGATARKQEPAVFVVDPDVDEVRDSNCRVPSFRRRRLPSEGVGAYVRPQKLLKNTSTAHLGLSNRGTDGIRIIQKALGHSDLSTILVYTHIVDGRTGESM